MASASESIGEQPAPTGLDSTGNDKSLILRSFFQRVINDCNHFRVGNCTGDDVRIIIKTLTAKSQQRFQFHAKLSLVGANVEFGVENMPSYETKGASIHNIHLKSKTTSNLTIQIAFVLTAIRYKDNAKFEKSFTPRVHAGFILLPRHFEEVTPTSSETS